MTPLLRFSPTSVLQTFLLYVPLLLDSNGRRSSSASLDVEMRRRVSATQGGLMHRSGEAHGDDAREGARGGAG